MPAATAFPKIYTVNGPSSTSSATLPSWLAIKSRPKRTESGHKKRVKTQHQMGQLELVQGFDFPTAAIKVKTTDDGLHAIATGTYKPMMKVWDLEALTEKFTRVSDAENVDFVMLSHDWTKSLHLQRDRSLQLHTQGGLHHTIRLPIYGRALGYHSPSADALVGCTGTEVFRFNLEEGRYMTPLEVARGWGNGREREVEGVNCVDVNPRHGLWSFGLDGGGGVVEFWDPRSRSALTRLTLPESSLLPAQPADANSLFSNPQKLSITSLKSHPTDGLSLAIGTSTGHTLLYDLRSSTPFAVKDQGYGEPVRVVNWLRGGGHQEDAGRVVSADSKVIKVWDKNEPSTNHVSLHPPNSLVDLHPVPGSGLMFVACDAAPLNTYYIPEFGPAPRWASFLDSITEENAEDMSGVGRSAYADYKFVDRAELETLALTHLIGTPTLKPYMHGYFLSLKLYQTARLIANPQSYAEHRDKVVSERLRAKTESRIRAKRDQPKVNKALAERLRKDQEREEAAERRKRAKRGEAEEAAEEAQGDDTDKVAKPKKENVLQDPRFAEMFSNPDFEIDETSRTFQLLNPATAYNNAAAATANGRRKTAVEEEEDDSDRSSSDGFSESENESEDEPGPEASASESESEESDDGNLMQYDPQTVKSASASRSFPTASGSRRPQLVTGSAGHRSRPETFGQRLSASARGKARASDDTKPDGVLAMRRAPDGGMEMSYIPQAGRRDRAGADEDDEYSGGTYRHRKDRVERFGAGLEKGGGEDEGEYDRSGRTKRRHIERSASKNAFRRRPGHSSSTPIAAGRLLRPLASQPPPPLATLSASSSRPPARGGGHGLHGHARGPGPRPRSVSPSSSSPSPSPPSSPRIGLRPLGRDKKRTNSSSRPHRQSGSHTQKSGSGHGHGHGHGHGPSHTSSHPQLHVRETSSRSTAGGAGAGPSTSGTSAVTPDGADGPWHYMGSASSVGIAHSGDERDRDGFVFPLLNGEDTEVELQRRRRDQPSPTGHSGPSPRQGTFGHVLADRDRPPTPQPRGGTKRVPPDVAAHPLPARITLLPHTFSIGPLSLTLNRKRCEDILLLGAVVVGIAKLAYTWNEWALAGELSTLLILSIAYTGLRVRTVRNPLPPSPTGARARLPHAPPMPTIRERNRRASHASNGRPGSPAPSRAGSMAEDEPLTVGARGCIWGTEEREYRECLDDGALFALLLSPLTAAALLHGALSRLASNPDSALLPGWEVEPPLVIPTTPIRRISATVPDGTSDTVLALSALATGRRNLVQLFTLLSFVLLVQLSWSLRREVRFAKASLTPPPPTVSIGPGTGASGSAPSVSGHSDGEAERTAHGTYWLRRGEWRRNGSVIAFAFIVTGGCVIVKIVTAYVGHGVWSDMSHSDIVIATLFYQFCLYVCVRLARRGFTLGELGIVTHAATALFMETVNLTRTQIPIFRMAYIKTYRLPTPLLIFQLALIPGSLLTGFLLSPILHLARHLAQRPAHRLRFPHEKPMHRRLLAIAFYAGALLVVVGIVGTWTRWMLGWRNPWLWVIFFLLEGKHAWTRPILISYWVVLAMVSVAGWQRQLSRARRHRRYVVPGREGSTSASSSISSAPTSVVQDAPSLGSGGMSGVATQMMDAADKRVPTLSINARRKSFHALAVAMFIPGIAVDPAFTHLSFSVAFAAFTFAEYVRYFALWPLGASVHIFLNEFIDHKDSGTAILSHFYLLAGCATPLWFEGPSQLLSLFGVLSLGVGDALASIVGRRIGYARWTPVSGKTAEGSAAFLASVVAAGVFMWIIGIADAFAFVPYVVATALATLLEAFSAQNDNLVLPVYGWAVGTLLGV